MTSGPVYFGRVHRRLYGMRHGEPQFGSVLICPPLLQDALRSHRALWTLSEKLAAAGMQVLCFDWHGTGDSSGESGTIDFSGLLDDLDFAVEQLRSTRAAGGSRERLLGLRSAAIPLVVWAAAKARPVDLVLWDPQLDGERLVADWNGNHDAQLRLVGRYPFVHADSAKDELLGFDVGTALIEPLRLQDTTGLALPAGSRVLLAIWKQTDELDRFAAAQRGAGIEVTILPLEATEAPDWDDPYAFESQVYPRRSVAALARFLAAAQEG